MRRLLGVLVGVSVALLGAEILGEYEFKGFTGAVSGLLFGLFVAEVVVAVSGERSNALAAMSAAIVVAGLGWAIWKSTGQSHDRSNPVPVGAWIGLGLGTAVTLLRVRSSASTTPHSHPEP